MNMPPQSRFVPLTDEQIMSAACNAADALDATRVNEMKNGAWHPTTIFDGDSGLLRFGRLIEQALNAAASENRTRDPAPLELVTDPSREDNWAGKTGILVRAKLPDGSFGSVDIAELDRASLWTWLRSRGGRNLWAENLILTMLEHKQITESEDAANR